MTKSPPVFIVGTGRCGSTLMSNLINMHPDILSLSEVFVSFANEGFVHKNLDGEGFWNLLTDTAPILRSVINPDRSPVEFTYEFTEESPWTIKDLPACLFMTLPHFSDKPDALYRQMEPVIRGRPKAPLGEQYQFWFDWMTAQDNKSMWIERSGNSITMVESLQKHFPDAKFIHIHRDGRETAMSIRNFMPLRMFLHMWTRLRKLGVDLLKPPFRYSDSRLIATFSRQFVSMLPVERYLDTVPEAAAAGRFWSAMIKQGMKELAAVPAENVHTMTYTDLVERPRETLETFINFAAPDLDHGAWLDKAAKVPQKSEPKWKELPAAEQEKLTAACAPGMKLLGYT